MTSKWPGRGRGLGLEPWQIDHQAYVFILSTIASLKLVIFFGSQFYRL